MANYAAVSRTNYFRVTDEEAYQKLFSRLTSESGIEDFTEERDGVLWHGFGAYSTIDFGDGEDEDFNYFLKKLQEILPNDEAFIYKEAGNEKLRHVVGFVIVVTRHFIRGTSLDEWAKEQAKELLGESFETELTM